MCPSNSTKHFHHHQNLMRARPGNRSLGARLLPVQTPKYNRKSRPFVDRVRVLLSSGRGGDGASIMGAVKNQEFAGPVGGNGGQGGHVFLRTTNIFPDLHHIASLGPSVAAGHGNKGRDMQEYGRSGRHLTLDVPVGTVVRDADTNNEICDLEALGQTVMVLEGGIGGKGNAAFKSSTCVSPINSTRGLPGNSLFANLELKLLADVALVGFPNAGKSSLLSAMTTSRPEVAPYPFTTLNPFVGKLYSFLGEDTCNVADLPGLVSGAFENRGLGHQFLQHVERSKMIALVVDMSTSSLEADEFGPLLFPSGRGGDAAEDAAANGGDDAAASSVLFDHPDRELAVNISRRARMSTAALGQTSKSVATSWGGSSLNSSSEKQQQSALQGRALPPNIPEQVVETLIQELGYYDASLPGRISVVLCNKMDVKRDADGVDLTQKFLRLQRFVKQRLGNRIACFPVSANIALDVDGDFSDAVEQSQHEQQQADSSSSSTSSSKKLTADSKQKILDELNLRNHNRASGLPTAVGFLTKRVFEMQRRDRAEQQRDEAEGQRAVDATFSESKRTLVGPSSVEKQKMREMQRQKEEEEELARLETSFLLSDEERALQEREQASKSRASAVNRLISMQEGKRSPGRSLFSNSRRQQSLAAASEEEEQSHQYQKENYLMSSVSRSLGNANGWMVDAQLGDDGSLAPYGPLATTYGAYGDILARDLAAADDPLGKFRVTGKQISNNNSSGSGSGRGSVAESSTAFQRRATLGPMTGGDEN